ncbi:MAG: ChaN family lipoprotein [Sulfurimonas sp.]|uniref:ChaN family lipoprotein n=1 Tax=Sulfurimonas sp. TaxID=2022749 RepID=UPI0028CC5D21|nr:ChaN family lipoprotein [Sulfurimonas sp.]MDT8338900.1 ChaN family lipoprotein [Sulfurimonas sp.]
MKKLLLLSSLFTSIVYAHECRYTLNIDLDINKGLLEGRAIISTDHPTISLLDTKANISEIKGASLSVEKNIPTLVKQNQNEDVEISFTHKFDLVNSDVVLLESWYPRIDMMCKYETVVSNPEIRAIVEATTTKSKDGVTTFIFDYPLDRVNLIASKDYKVNSVNTKNGLKLATYFYSDNASLRDKYFKKSKEYFELYKELFGFLPYNNFSIVETQFPAGYSMPTYTLIGKQIIDKEYVLDSSLGHEIAHQWFGNYVYAPYKGNWVEGITTYYADYLYAKKAKKEVEYRKDMLIKYDSYVNAHNEIAPIDFEHKTQNSKNAIGYEKSAFFFYMLEQKIGEKAFDEGTKTLLQEYAFKTATYDNLKEIYEKSSNQKLDNIFKNLIYEKGALDFSISNTSLMFVEDKYVLEFDIVSNNKAEFIPISICSNKECLTTKIDLSSKKQRFELDIEPTKIVLDENYELFRRLHPLETPPVISKIIEGNALVVVDRADEEKFSKFKKIFKNFKYADEVKYEELKSNNIFILGAKNSLLNQISIPFEMQGDAKIELFKNPLNGAYVAAVFEMEKLSRSIFYRLRHLGKYSKVIFEGEKIVEKSTKESQKGIVYNINGDSYAIKPAAKNLNDVVDEIAKNRVVYIGEKHTEFSSHLNQLKIIKAMYKQNPKLAIGMEMFQHQFQKHLDDFIAGKISEKEMIAKTEYFKRWKYDYELYRPIILFAKAKRIPIVALNIDREITRKVVNGGFDSLSKEQLEVIPGSINFENSKYREQLKGIFGMHESKSFKNFDEFYHAQLLWDESMAKNMAEFMNKNPAYSMAVLAGNGHVMHGHGIPDRAKRRGVSDYIIVLNYTNPEPGVADYLLYPSAVTTKKAKKLGIYFEENENLEVKKLVDDSPAQKAKIEAKDRVVAIDGAKVESIFDVKTELAFAKDSLNVTLMRDSKKIEVTLDLSE